MTTDTTIDFGPLLALRDEADRSAAALAEVAPIVAEARRVLGEVERSVRWIDRQIRATLGDDTSRPSSLDDLGELIFHPLGRVSLRRAVRFVRRLPPDLWVVDRGGLSCLRSSCYSETTRAATGFDSNGGR